MKRALFLISAVLIFTSCKSPKETLEETRRINQNSPVYHAAEQKSSQKQQISQQERILNMKNSSKMQMAKMKIEHDEKLAKIAAQKEEKLKEIEAKKAKELEQLKLKQKEVEANRTLEVAKMQSQEAVAIKEKEVGLYKTVAVIVLFIAFLWLIIAYLKHLAKQRHEAHLKEQELKFQAHIKETEMKHQNISKMLDIISSDKSDPAVKKEITKILSYNKGNLIEHKKG